MAKAIIEYNLPEDKEELDIVMNAVKCYQVLCKVDKELHRTLKHGDDEWLKTEAHDYLEMLRELIWNSGVLHE